MSFPLHKYSAANIWTEGNKLHYEITHQELWLSGVFFSGKYRNITFDFIVSGFIDVQKRHRVDAENARLGVDTALKRSEK